MEQSTNFWVLKQLCLGNLWANQFSRVYQSSLSLKPFVKFCVMPENFPQENIFWTFSKQGKKLQAHFLNGVKVELGFWIPNMKFKYQTEFSVHCTMKEVSLPCDWWWWNDISCKRRKATSFSKRFDEYIPYSREF